MNFSRYAHEEKNQHSWKLTKFLDQLNKLQRCVQKWAAHSGL